MNNRRGHVSGYQSILQGVDSQCRRHLRIHGITDDPIGEDILDGTEVELAFAGRVLGVGVGPGRPSSLSTGGFPRPALRTGRATLTASGSPRVVPLVRVFLLSRLTMVWVSERLGIGIEGSLPFVAETSRCSRVESP